MDTINQVFFFNFRIGAWIIQLINDDSNEVLNEEEDGFFEQPLELFSQSMLMEKNSSIASQHINMLADVSSFMKSINEGFEKPKNLILREPGAFYTHLEELLKLTC